MPKVMAKPLMTELPNQYKTRQVKSEEKLESLIEVQARLNHSSTALA